MEHVLQIKDTSKEPDQIIKNAMRSILLATFIHQLLTNTATLVDTLIVGKFYGDIALSACGITYNLVFINITLGSIFSVGAQLNCATALGAGDQKQANCIFSASIVLSLILSMILSAFVLCFPGLTASFFGASTRSPELHTVTEGYIRGLATGFPADYLVSFLSAVLLLDGGKNKILLSAGTMIAVNVAGDLLNVFVLGWGMAGIGLATAVSNYFALAVLLLHFATPRHRFRFVRPDRLFYWLRVFFSRSAASIFGRMMKWLYFMLFVRIILWLASDDSLAAYSAFNSFRNILICSCLGLGSANMLLANVMYSENNVRGLRQVVRTGLKYCLLLGAGIGFLAALLAKQIISFYGAEEITQEAVLILRIYGAFFCIEFLKFYYSFYTRAIYKKGISTFYNIFGEFFFPALSALVLGLLFGSTGIWVSIPVGSALAVLSVIVFSRFKNGRTDSLQDDLMLLPRSFFDGQDTCLNVSPRGREESSAYSEAARCFLLEKGYPDRTANAVALSIEELLENIRERADKVRNTDLFVTVGHGMITVRIRCDGKLVNPISVADLYHENARTVYGPAIISRIADSMEYNTSMGVNNLIVSFRTASVTEMNEP